ncbi:MAG TPA: RagB/SusD family nutrient uptake outer membrane protein [Pseudosphingobacterium sp.]|nr:RagB/SusD family nutrient uptake outer membrane protein [Pseudosphingobacterium sp.]
MKRFILYMAIGVVLTITSCSKDFLNETPYSSYTPEKLTDALGFEASLTGLYNHLSTIYSWSDRQGWVSVWQVGTDVANATNNLESVEIPYFNYSLLNSEDGAAARMWNRCYIMINLTNIIINSIEGADVTGLSQEEKNAINAEAKFFRAFAYNTLATLYGSVPVITTALSGPKTDFVRAPLEEVNGLIISDLQFASQSLPHIDEVKSNTAGRMFARANRFMAMQLLGEVYLRTDQPALAEEQLSNIINSGAFQLVSNRYGVKEGQKGDPFSDMFVYGNQRRDQGNTEAIWVMEQENPATVVGGITDNPQQRRVWGAAYHNVPGMVLADSLGGRGLGRLRLSNWVLYGLYQPGDVRNSENNIRRRYYYNNPTSPNFGKPVPYAGADTAFNIAPHTTKWYQFDPNDTFGYAMIKDFILMRLGETYLLLAEAQFKQGKLQEAADNINKLRERAFADYPQKGQVLASDITLDFILDERARELIGEENRRMTLMRTKTLVERAIRLNSNSAVNPLRGISPNNLLLPIPLREIQLNKDAILEQNPGYN